MPVKILNAQRPQPPDEVVVLAPKAVVDELFNIAHKLLQEGKSDLIILLQGVTRTISENGKRMQERILLKAVVFADSRGERIDPDGMLAIEKFVKRDRLDVVAWAHLHPFPDGHTWLSEIDRRTLKMFDWLLDPGVVFIVLSPPDGISAWVYDRGRGRERRVELKTLNSSMLHKNGVEEPLGPGARGPIIEPQGGGELLDELRELRKTVAGIYQSLQISQQALEEIAWRLYNIEKAVKKKKRIPSLFRRGDNDS